MANISVVVPVYKVEQFLHRCVDSILCQSYEAFDLILVDDGSPDNCGKICEEYAEKDSRVHVIHQKNGGLSAARNTGIAWSIANSDSRWIAFVDSDDWVHPRFLEKLGLALQESNVKPEIEVFDAGMIYNTIYYMKKGILKAPCHYQIVLGCAGGMTSTVENLVHLRSIMPEGSTWAACGISAGHLPIMMATIAMGGHLRVGLEDNLYMDRGVLAKSNVELVERAVKLLELNNLEPATPDEAREIYGLTRKVF